MSDDNDPNVDGAVDEDDLAAIVSAESGHAFLAAQPAAHSYTVTDICDLALVCVNQNRDPLAIAWLNLAEAMMRR